MEQDRAFERRFSINVARLKEGRHEEAFDIDDEFFAYMASDLIPRGRAHATLEMTKYSSHIDARFAIGGEVEVQCDRCNQPYMQPIEQQRNVIYSFDPDLKFDNQEVIYVEPDETELSVKQELYDFVHLALPMRRVPELSIHRCPPEVMELLGLDENGEPIETDEDETSDEPVDERWEALRRLRDQMEN